MSATMRCRDGRATCRFSAWCATSDATLPGDAAAGFAAAAEIARALADAGVPALAPSATLADLEARPQDYAPAYLVHEFMHAGWRPLYVTEMRPQMAAIGLAPVGSATLIENFDALVFGDAARAILRGVADPDARELVRDFLLDQRLRCDVFDRGNRRLDPAERARRLLASSYALARPAAAIRYSDHDSRRANATMTARRRGRSWGHSRPAHARLTSSFRHRICSKLC